MLTTPRKLIFVASLLLCWSGAANAQFEVKRIKCTELVSTLDGPHRIFNARAGDAKITFQVIKDRCRPTNDGGFYQLWSRSSSGGGSGVPLHRNGRQTIAMSRNIPRFGDAELLFIPRGGARVSGYVDYVFTVE